MPVDLYERIDKEARNRLISKASLIRYILSSIPIENIGLKGKKVGILITIPVEKYSVLENKAKAKKMNVGSYIQRVIDMELEGDYGEEEEI